MTADIIDKSSNGRASWLDSKPLKTILTVAGIGLGTAIVPQQNPIATYAAAAVVGGLVGWAWIDPIFGFELNYDSDDENAKLKGSIEGIIIGALLGTGITAMRDNRLSQNHKLYIAAGLGSILGFNVVRSEFLGEHSECVNWVGAIAGAAAGAGIMYGINKLKNQVS